MLMSNNLNSSRIEAALEDAFVPKEQATFIDDLKEIERLLTKLNFNSIMLKGNFIFTTEKIYIGMPLSKFQKYSTCKPYETRIDKKIQTLISPISSEDGLQLEIKNYFTDNEALQVYVPIAPGIIVEQYIKDKEYKALFLITLNLLDLNDSNNGIIKLNINKS